MTGVIGGSGGGVGLEVGNDPLVGDLMGLEDLIGVLVDGSTG